MNPPRLAAARSRPTAARSSKRRPLAVLLAGIVGALLLVGVIAWWSDRPISQAEAALDAGRPAEALRIANELLRSRPGYGPAAAMKARALVEVGRPREAVALFEEYGTATPSELHAHAKALMLLGRWEAARLLLEEFLRHEPEDADALHELTACYAQLGRFRESLVTAAKFAKRPGLEARGQLLIGTIQRDLGNERQAAEAYARVLEVRPDADDLQVTPAEFFHAYGLVLMDLGRPADAVPHFERSVAATPAAHVFSDLGRAYEQVGRADEADRAWRSAISQNPEDRTAREGLAGAALGRGESAAAIALLGPLVDEPTASIAYLLQRAYAIKGDGAESERWKSRAEALRAEERLRGTVERVLKNAPDSPWAAVLRAYRFSEQGLWSEAEAQMATVGLDEPFVATLRDAIRRRGALPPLTDLPISQF